MGLFDSEGLIGGVHSELFGEAAESDISGAFPGLEELGAEYQKFLLERLRTPTLESEQFRFGTQAIRDALSTSSATARQRFGDIAQTRGFLDSGAVISGLTEIERAGGEAFAREILNLYLSLEERREFGLLPFLSQGASEFGNIEALNLQGQLAADQQIIDMTAAIGSIVPG